MARRTKEQKRQDDLVTRLCNSLMSGWQINIMDMHHLSDAGKAAALAGKSDAEVEAAMVEARGKYAKAS